MYAIYAGIVQQLLDHSILGCMLLCFSWWSCGQGICKCCVRVDIPYIETYISSTYSWYKQWYGCQHRNQVTPHSSMVISTGICWFVRTKLVITSVKRSPQQSGSQCRNSAGLHSLGCQQGTKSVPTEVQQLCRIHLPKNI